MNLNLTERQKTLLVSALLTLFVVVGAIFGYEVKTAPLPKPTQETEIGAQSLQNTGIKCGASADPCVISNWGRDINVYSDEQSTSKFSVDGATGDTVIVGTLGVTGALTQSGGQANSNWVNIAAPTAIGSATPALVVNSAGVSNLLEARKNATPVFSVSGAGNTTIGGTLGVTGLVTINGVKCYKGQQSVLGAATAIPATLTAAGISTPAWVSQSFAASPGDTYWQHSHTNAAGVVTFNVYQRLLSGTVTPQAATTTVALDYEVCGQ